MIKRISKVLALAGTISIISCASVAHYPVSLKYESTRYIPPAEKGLQQSIITVALFNDLRKVTDRWTIGRKVESDGKEIKVISKSQPPSDAVARAIGAVFSKVGYTVSGETPHWDLREGSIRPSMGKIVIGGNIDELVVECYTGFLKAQYESRVRLRVIVADVEKNKIIYTTNVDSSNSFRDVAFSEEKMEEQANNALSTAIERILENRELRSKIEEVLRKRS
ncbi:MAG: hypothetical protein AB1488_05940 [Nitrospirota bacterium]